MNKKIIDKITSANSILITAHPNSDHDSLGSILAMYKICLQIGKLDSQLKCLVWESLDHLNINLPLEELVQTYNPDFQFSNYDLVIFVDIGHVNRIKFWPDILEQIPTKIVIDHHIDSCEGVEQNIDILVAKQTLSTTVLIYQFFLENKDLQIDKELAQFLLAGIYGDSDFFTLSGLTDYEFDLISKLLKYGANLDELIIRSVKSNSLSKVKAIAMAIQKTVIENDFAYCILNHQELLEIKDKTGYMLSKQEVVNELKNLDQIDFALVIFETKNNFLNCSLRSRTYIRDINQIAQSYGGGGHTDSAAFRFDVADFDLEAYNVITNLKKYTH